MRRVYLSLLVILIGIFIVFALVDRKGSYVAESKLWHINNTFAKASRDPQVVPDISFVQIIHEYEQFIKDYPNSPLIPMARTMIGRVYMIQKKYDQARNVYENIAKLYVDQPEIAVEVIADIGRSYALENNIDGIISNYKRVIKDYPTTQIGMQAPILLAEFYQKQGDEANAREAFKEAEKHYQKLIKDNPDSSIEFDSLRSLGTMYLSTNQKREAVETFGNILIKFPQKEYLTSERANLFIKTINTISIIDLKDYDLPISIYEEFIKIHPDHPFTKSFKDLAESMKLLKESKLTIDRK